MSPPERDTAADETQAMLDAAGITVTDAGRAPGPGEAARDGRADDARTVGSPGATSRPARRRRVTGRPIRLVLDTTAALAYAHGSDAVGETIRELLTRTPATRSR